MIEHFLPAASSFAGRIDFTFDLIFWLTGFWFLLSEVIFFWLIFRYRKKDGVRGQYVTGELKSEKRWITIPHLLVLLCDCFILFFAIQTWYVIKQQLPPADETVRIVGQQWAWSFELPGPDGKLGTADDIRTVDELHVQVNKVYHFKLEARDVVHSFSVPAFRLKQDAMPGRVITGWFKPIKTGSFDIQCTQICGIGHGIMGAQLVVETPEQHAAWIAAHSTTSVAAVASPPAGE
jgi:cytochrome c oxidase subunit 2